MLGSRDRPGILLVYHPYSSLANALTKLAEVILSMVLEQTQAKCSGGFFKNRLSPLCLC